MAVVREKGSLVPLLVRVMAEGSLGCISGELVWRGEFPDWGWMVLDLRMKAKGFFGWSRVLCRCGESRRMLRRCLHMKGYMLE
jgi:hypothetical protein